MDYLLVILLLKSTQLILRMMLRRSNAHNVVMHLQNQSHTFAVLLKQLIIASEREIDHVYCTIPCKKNWPLLGKLPLP